MAASRRALGADVADDLGKRRKRGAHFIAGAIKHKGALTAQAHKVDESPMEFAEEHKHDSGTTGRRARFALELRKFHHKGKNK